MVSVFVKDDDLPAMSSLAGKNLALEAEVQRLTALGRRRALGLQQMLSYELRTLAREERDRQWMERIAAREAVVEAKRRDFLYAVGHARQQQDRERQEKGEKVERVMAETRARQNEAARRLEENNQLRQRQRELLAQRRKEDTAKKTAILQSRIARSARIRNIRQLHSKRIAVKKADAKKASGDAARRAREANNEARKAAKAAKAAAVRAAFEEMNRRQRIKKESIRAATERKLYDTMVRVELSRERQKEAAERKRALEGEVTRVARQRQETPRPQHLDWDAKRGTRRVDGNDLREKQVALTLEIRKEQEEAASRGDRRQEKEENIRRVHERRMKIEEGRREAARQKLEEDAAKIELLRSEKERLQATHDKLSSETTKQREALKEYIKALKNQSQGRRSFDIVAGVESTATLDTADAPLTGTRRRAGQTIDGRSKRDKTREGDNAGRDCVTKPASCNAKEDISGDTGRGPHRSRHRRAPATAPSVSLSNETGAITGAVLCREDARRKPQEGSALLHWPQAPVSSKTSKSSSSLRSRSAATGRPRGLIRGFHSSRVLDENYQVSYDGNTAQHQLEGTASSTWLLSPPRFSEDDVPSVDASVRKKNFAADLVRSYINIGASSSQACLLRRAQKARNKEGAALVNDGGAKNRHAKRRSKIGHRRPLVRTPEDVSQLHRVADTADSSEAAAALEVATWQEQHVAPEPLSISVTPQDVLLKRYDCEFLDVLEKEQAAEGARVEGLTAAKERAKVSQDRVRIMDHSDRALDSGAIPSIADNDGIETPEQCNNVLEGTGNDIRTEGLIKGGGWEAVVGGSGSATDSGRRKIEEVAGTTQELKRLAEELASERQLASERIMRMSKAYEYDIRKLAEQYQDQHHDLLSGCFALPSSVYAQ